MLCLNIKQSTESMKQRTDKLIFFWLVTCKCNHAAFSSQWWWRLTRAGGCTPLPLSRCTEIRSEALFFFFPSANFLHQDSFIKRAWSHTGPAHLQRRRWGGAPQAGF